MEQLIEKKAFFGKKQKSYDSKWMTINIHRWNKPDGIRLTFSPASYFDNRWHICFCIGWLSAYIHLPIYSNWDGCEYPEYGFYYHENALVLEYGYNKNKFIYMPWYYEWYRTSKLKADGSWWIEKKGDVKRWRKLNPNKTTSQRWKEEEESKGDLWKETRHYKYTTKYNEVQDDIEATIGVSEMEHRPKWFMWTSLFAKVRRSIDVEFSEEVGSERGSWKGGVLGCGYTMLAGETPEQTLMRMQEERSFDR